MWSIAARACAGYGLLQHECVLSWSITARVCADVVYCSTSVCCHGQFQHVCAGYGISAALGCAEMVYHNTCVCWYGSKQCECALSQSPLWHKRVGYRYSVFPRLPLVTQNTA